MNLTGTSIGTPEQNTSIYHRYTYTHQNDHLITLRSADWSEVKQKWHGSHLCLELLPPIAITIAFQCPLCRCLHQTSTYMNQILEDIMLLQWSSMKLLHVSTNHFIKPWCHLEATPKPRSYRMSNQLILCMSNLSSSSVGGFILIHGLPRFWTVVSGQRLENESSLLLQVPPVSILLLRFL